MIYRLFTGGLTFPANKPVAVGLFFLGACLAVVGFIDFLRLTWKPKKHDPSSRLIMVILACIVGMYALLPPILSTDVVTYYRHAWVFIEYGGDPCAEVPSVYPNVPGIDVISVIKGLSPYGALWTGIETALYRLSGGSLLLGVCLFKVLAATAIFIMALMAYSISGYTAPGMENRAAVLLGANPLLLVEGAGMAHNDAVGLMFVLLGIWLFLKYKEQPWVGMVALFGAFLIKLPAVVAIFVYLVWMYRTSGGVTWFARQFLKAAIPCTALFFLLSFPFIREPASALQYCGLNGLKSFYTTRFNPVWLIGKFLPANLIQYVPLLLVGVGFLVILVMIRQAKGDAEHIAVLGPAYFIVTLVKISWRPWYTMWPAATGALSPKSYFAYVNAAYAFAALLSNLLMRSSGVSIFG